MLVDLQAGDWRPELVGDIRNELVLDLGQGSKMLVGHREFLAGLLKFGIVLLVILVEPRVEDAHGGVIRKCGEQSEVMFLEVRFRLV